MERLLELRARGKARRTWRQVQWLASQDVTRVSPFTMEFDLVGVIAFRELGYAPEVDGEPMQPDLDFVAVAEKFAGFAGEPFDLPAELPRFIWPTAVISGERDLRTPRAFAEEATDLLPNGIFLPLSDHAHSALDTHPAAAREVIKAMRDGSHARLPARAAELSKLPKPLTTRVVSGYLSVALRLAAALPGRSGPA